MRRSASWNCFSKLVLPPAVVILIAVAAVSVSRLTAAQNAAPGPQAAADQSTQSATAEQGGATANLAGTWKLNRDQSDNPQEKMQDAGGLGGRGGGMGRRRGGTGGMMNGLSQLTIEQSAASIRITNADGREIAQYSSSGSASDNAPFGEWHGAQFVSTTQGRRGGSTTRTFELSPDGKQLYMVTKIDNPRLQQPVSVRFVYDRAKSSE